VSKLVIRITKLHCHRCNHSWVPNKVDVRICPKCKSARWDTPKESVK
jgi:Zn finger protein HypA/HybF involved in hydrogenase expression